MMSMTGTTTRPEWERRWLADGLEVGVFSSWTHFPALTHFTTLRGEAVAGDPFSSFNLGRHSGEALSRVMQNRNRLCRALSLPAEALVQPRQVHGNEVLPLLPDFFEHTGEERVAFLSQADGLVTGAARRVCGCLDRRLCTVALLRPLPWCGRGIACRLAGNRGAYSPAHGRGDAALLWQPTLRHSGGDWPFYRAGGLSGGRRSGGGFYRGLRCP